MLKSLRRILRRPFSRRKKTPPVVDRRSELAAQFPDFSARTLDLILAVEPCTMTSPERIESLCSSVDYISNSGVSGDIVECGVWRGGSMMAIAKSLLQNKDTHRTLHLYDTFEGMPPAQEVDKDYLDAGASQLLGEQNIEDPQSIWCYSGLDEVKNNMASTHYPHERIRYVKGKVEDTLFSDLPDQIALLRLDTDWYESTRVCLEQLYPRLVPGGVLIIDDYGHWQGCRKAVDEYFASHGIPVHLQRIDYTGRIAIKQADTVSHARKIPA